MASSATAPYGFVPFDFKRHRQFTCLFSLSLSPSRSFALTLALSFFFYIFEYVLTLNRTNPMFSTRRRLAGLLGCAREIVKHT